MRVTPAAKAGQKQAGVCVSKASRFVSGGVGGGLQAGEQLQPHAWPKLTAVALTYIIWRF